MAIDMFYWGERRMLLPDDPPSYRERPVTMTDADIRAFNQRASQDESLVGRSLFTAGITWPGVILWDDIRALDYLASRPEVDAKRLGCVGLSVGGYRSYLLAALDERIKAAVDVGWMTSFGAQIRQHVIHTIGLSFHINGLYRYLDFPDLAALAAPRALMVINGSQDRLFALEGVKAAFDKIARAVRQGRRTRSRALPAVRRPARVQPRDAGGGVGVAGEVGLVKSQAPSSKSQRTPKLPNPKQLPTVQDSLVGWTLGVGSAWDLELGIWDLTALTTSSVSASTHSGTCTGFE